METVEELEGSRRKRITGIHGSCDTLTLTRVQKHRVAAKIPGKRKGRRKVEQKGRPGRVSVGKGYSSGTLKRQGESARHSLGKERRGRMGLRGACPRQEDTAEWGRVLQASSCQAVDCDPIGC